jgi:membrane associated rhomboid family serine protease
MFTLLILSATVITSLTALYAMPELMQKGMLYPYQVVHEKKWYQLITHGFLHADLTHLAFNMITLYFFGPILEQVLGSALYVLLYFLGLILASVTSVIKHKDNKQYASLGASGAVEGVIFGFIILYPLEKIYLFFIPIGIPAVIFGFLYMAYSIYAGKAQKGRVNHDAHIAGAIWGVLFTLIAVPNSYTRFVNQIMDLFS